MYLISEVPRIIAPPPRSYWSVAGGLTVSELTDEHTEEILTFLDQRPLHTFAMAGFIRDNGLVSEHNRGAFYACRGREGRLEGVALAGHAVLFETRSDAAIKAFAGLTRRHPEAYLVLGEQMKVERFNYYYSRCNGAPRLTSNEILFETRCPVEPGTQVTGLRPASVTDLQAVGQAHAQFAMEDRGINPLDGDAEGFLKRCARRIQVGRTWLLKNDGDLVFKADVVVQTPEITYLEGIWTHPAERGKGYGRACLSQLVSILLQSSRSICLLVSAERSEARRFYLNTGFWPIGSYETLYL